VPLPTFTADSVRSWIWAAPNGASGASALVAVVLLVGWTALAFAAAILVFARQDLAQE
jgi:ABC-type transport system involved in multi-copper enzyme maturation permease subunit